MQYFSRIPVRVRKKRYHRIRKDLARDTARWDGY
jgi:hypothetical protein